MTVVDCGALPYLGWHPLAVSGRGRMGVAGHRSLLQGQSWLTVPTGCRWLRWHRLLFYSSHGSDEIKGCVFPFLRADATRGGMPRA